jgi:hypothetical protein
MPTPRTAAEILDYHRRAVVALRELARAFEGLNAKDRACFPRAKQAFLDVLEEMRDELDDEVVLALVASAERLLRLDYAARLRVGGKDAPAVRFGELERRFDRRAPFEEIVDVWKDLTAAGDEAGRFKQMYVYRHGLAHGRYFNKSGLHDAAPEDADEVIRELFAAIRAHTADFPKS